ncbi:OmpH family outer membrane protein [Proteobacteria bacterium 005FR1]|nr:OmpH family outer membrane protein [Proteobacteria bacterium 005FR1]
MLNMRLIGLVLFAIVLSACARNSPESVAERYWQAVLADDQQTIQSVISDRGDPNLSKVIQPGPGSKVTVERAEREAPAGPDQTDATSPGGIAEVPTTIYWVDEDGKTSTFQTETVLVFEGDTWKVDPDRTRERFFDSVYRSALTGLEAALEEGAKAFRELGNTVSETMARELSAASEELQKQSKEANEELQRFLESLDEELQKELEKRQAQ